MDFIPSIPHYEFKERAELRTVPSGDDEEKDGK